MEKAILINEIIEYIKDYEIITVSMLQRNFKIGYSLGNEVLEDLEKRGYLVSDDKTGIRKVVKGTVDSEPYIYSATTIKDCCGFNQGTFYNRLDETGIRDKGTKDYNIEYAKKDLTTGKIMFNQKAYDLLSKYKDNSKSDVNMGVSFVKNTVNSDVISLQLHNEVVDLLKKQLEDRDREISNYLDIISKKDVQIEKFQEQNRNFQVLIKEKDQKILQLGTNEDNKKWWHFWKKDNKEEIE